MKATKTKSVDEWLNDLANDPASLSDASRLRAIGGALTALEDAQNNLDRAVQEAKDAGESWAAISVVLGTSRQAAHKRFRKSA